MIAISSSQKKTAFAVILLALIAVWVMISGRGGFSGLRSDAFNNPSFVCTNESLMSGEVHYQQAGERIQKLSTEKTNLQKQTQSWSSDILKNETQIKKLENDKKAAEKTERTLEAYIKKNCGPKSVANCATKKKDLQKVQQEIKKIQISLTSSKTQINQIRTNIQSAESNIKLLEKQIQEIKNFKEDFYTCKMALVKPIISGEVGVADFELIVSWEVFVNEPFDMTVKALSSSGTINNTYTGKIFFDTNNNAADVLLPNEENDGGSEYQFNLADGGIHTFQRWFVLKKAGKYELIIFELNWPNGGISKTVLVVAKERTSPGTCTDGDGGIRPFIKWSATGLPAIWYHSVYTWQDICFQAESLTDNNPLWPNAAGQQGASCEPGTLCYVKEAECVSKNEGGVSGTMVMMHNIPCPNGCSNGACRQWVN